MCRLVTGRMRPVICWAHAPNSGLAHARVRTATLSPAKLHELAPGHAPGQSRGGRRGREVGQEHGRAHGGQLGEDRAQGLGAIEVLAPVPVAIDGQQHDGLDLGEAVDHAARAELGGGARPDRADRGDRQQRGEGLGDVGHVGDDAIAARDPQRAQSGGHLRDLGGELRPGERVERAQLRGVHHRYRVRIALAHEHVLRIVELGAVEPARAGHASRVEHLRVRARGAHVAVLPHGGPELLDLRHRPLPQLAVVGERPPGALARPAHEPCHLRALAPLLGWTPQRRWCAVPLHRAIMLARRGRVIPARRVSRVRADRLPERGHRRAPARGRRAGERAGARARGARRAHDGPLRTAGAAERTAARRLCRGARLRVARARVDELHERGHRPGDRRSRARRGR